MPSAFWAGGDADLHKALWRALAPLRAAAARAPRGCLSHLPSNAAAAAAASRPLYIVVLGETGAGKSSTLNALIGETRLLPTNAMRACTAAIVEARCCVMCPMYRTTPKSLIAFVAVGSL